jgi:PAS domain S-box-containing protein
MSDDAPLWIDTDAEGRIVNWSRDALSLTGYSERAVVGHSLPLMLAKDRPDPAT